jgi:MFS family permease
MSNVLAFVAAVEKRRRSLLGKGMTTDESGAYRGRDVTTYFMVRFLSEAAAMAQSVAVGWTVYRLSRDPLALGIVGIVQFVPMFLLTLPAGELCDRHSPRSVLAAGLALEAVCAIAFLWLTVIPPLGLWPFYLVLLVLGAARGFTEPASQALLPCLVPPERIPAATSWGSSAWQLAVIAGPALGGLAYEFGPAVAYSACGMGFLAAMISVMALRGRQRAPVENPNLGRRVMRMIEGVKFVWSQPVVLGAISLDLCAVLLGGATALLPIYARDILHVGPIGLGLLRSAPAVGACILALIQARCPPDGRIGLKLFAAVAVFGAATLTFAFSTSFMLSLVALSVVGASDMVSVNIRSSLIQLATPDIMRGRVSSVNMLFIGASSELGAFESGITAALLGTVPAVAFGAIGTLVVLAIWIGAFPALRRADRISSIAAYSIQR